jgi:RimJ/RimL family protein N-acetyltransferase
MVDAAELGTRAATFPENVASRALLKGLCFAEIGIHRRHGRLDGLWRDCVIVERLLETGDGEHKG